MPIFLFSYHFNIICQNPRPLPSGFLVDIIVYFWANNSFAISKSASFGGLIGPPRKINRENPILVTEKGEFLV